MLWEYTVRDCAYAGIYTTCRDILRECTLGYVRSELRRG